MPRLRVALLTADAPAIPLCSVRPSWRPSPSSMETPEPGRCCAAGRRSSVPISQMDVTLTSWKTWRRFAVKLEQSFEVAAPIDRVWKALIDVERVAPCLPGANVTGRNEDGSYAGDLKIKIGPTTAAYSGRLEMETIDESSHTATMQAQGTDRRGQGGAKATITSKLSQADGGTRVEVSTDYHITGRLARFGRGGM